MLCLSEAVERTLRTNYARDHRELFLQTYLLNRLGEITPGRMDAKLKLPLLVERSANSASDVTSALAIASLAVHSVASSYALRKLTMSKNFVLQDISTKLLSTKTTLGKIARITNLVPDSTDTHHAAQALKIYIGLLKQDTSANRHGIFKSWTFGVFDLVLTVLVEGNDVYNQFHSTRILPLARPLVIASKRYLEQRQSRISAEGSGLLTGTSEPNKKVKLDLPSGDLSRTRDAATVLLCGPRSNSVPSLQKSDSSSATSSGNSLNIPCAGTSLTTVSPLPAMSPPTVHTLPEKPAFLLQPKCSQRHHCSTLAVPMK